jgi:hypothetical protein
VTVQESPWRKCGEHMRVRWNCYWSSWWMELRLGENYNNDVMTIQWMQIFWRTNLWQLKVIVVSFGTLWPFCRIT